MTKSTFIDDNLHIKDCVSMQKWGREFVTLFEPETALQNAAEYLVLATPEEYRRLFLWWEEGVRNNVHMQGQHGIDKAHKALSDRVNELSGSQ